MKFALTLLLFCLLQSLCASAQPILHPRVTWTYASGAPIRGAVAIERGKLFFGNSAGDVHALDRQSGELLWKTSTGAAIVSTPALAGGRVVVSDRENRIHALDAANGAVVWSFAAGKSEPHTWGWDYYLSSPVVHGDRVIVGSGDHSLYALSLEDGGVVWKVQTADKIRATPLVRDGRVYAPSFDGMLYVVEAATGASLGTFKTEGVQFYGQNHGWDRTSLDARPAWHDGKLVFGSRDGGLYSVDAASLAQTWRFSYGTSWSISSPAVRDGRVFVGWSDNNLFSAVDAASGRELWKQDCGGYVYSSPAVDERNVYVGSMNGSIFAFDQVSGAPAWTFPTGGAVLASPIVADGTLYVGSDDGRVYALTGGEPRHRAVYQTSGDVHNLLTAGREVAPYLRGRGYEVLDETTLKTFLEARIADGAASVVVFAHGYLADTVLGETPEAGLLYRYMASGGKVVWLAGLPKLFTSTDGKNVTGADKTYATQLLGLSFDVEMDLATYHARATEAGRAWGVPASFDAPGSLIAGAEGLTPLAWNELGRVAAFHKPMGPRKTSGFVQFCSWSLRPVRERDLEALVAIAEHGL